MRNLPFEVVGPSYLDGKKIPDELAEILLLEHFDEQGEEKFPM